MKNNLNLYLLISLLTSCASIPTNLFDSKLSERKDQRQASSTNIMISSQGVASSQAGLKIYKMGGNIVDVAAAITFAISVERPQSTGLGGGGFMLAKLRTSPEILALDFRETAPKKTHPKYFKGKSSTTGIHAVGTPGIVDGIFKILARHGKLGKTQKGIQLIMQPAIELAENGFKIYPHLEKSIIYKSTKLKELNLLTGSDFAKIYLDKDLKPKKTGQIIRQPDLARSLKLIAIEGSKAFYSGSIAKAIAKSSSQLSGAISLSDLQNYNSIWRKPIHGTYKDYSIYSMPIPSSGGIHLVQILNILEKLKLKKANPLLKNNVHKTVFAMQAAFKDRAKYLGDVSGLPVKGITSKKYAQQISTLFHPQKPSPSLTSTDQSIDPFSFESNDTTHFTVMDKDGNTISSTQTINGLFGSGIVAKGTGIVLNNEMDDFTTNLKKANMFGLKGNKANEVRYGKRPLSSMSPTIVTKNKRPILALGSPSGPRIINCVLLATLNYIEYKLPLFESVATARYHHQWLPEEIRMDSDFPIDVKSDLESMGYKTKSKKLGCSVQAIAVENKKLIGVSDPRGEGQSVGI